AARAGRRSPRRSSRAPRRSEEGWPRNGTKRHEKEDEERAPAGGAGRLTLAQGLFVAFCAFSWPSLVSSHPLAGVASSLVRLAKAFCFSIAFTGWGSLSSAGRCV